MPTNSYKDNPVTKAYEDRVKNLLKSELKRKGFGYADLAAKLDTIGVKESERNLANKISRGGFSAAFLFQCLDAIGCHSLRID